MHASVFVQQYDVHMYVELQIVHVSWAIGHVWMAVTHFFHSETNFSFFSIRFLQVFLFWTNAG